MLSMHYLRLTLPPVLLQLLLFSATSSELTAEAKITELECPLPDGPDSATSEVCRRYSACVWTNENSCRLTDRVGYRVQRAVRRRHSRQLLLTKLSNVTLFGEDVQRLVLTVTEHDRQRVRMVVSTQIVACQ